MESHPDPQPWYYWPFPKRATIVALTGLGLFLLVFQVNKMLSSSFRIEVFGVEILEVQRLEDTAVASGENTAEAPVVQERRVLRRHAPLPPPPPLLPMPPDEPEEEVRTENDFDACAEPVGLTSSDEGSEIFVVVEQMPELIGGLQAIQREIKYPEIAKRGGIEGRVILQFIVDKQGRVCGTKVVRGIGGGCDEEAVRVVSQARFKPGKQRGQPVPVKLSLPVTFRLQ